MKRYVSLVVVLLLPVVISATGAQAPGVSGQNVDPAISAVADAYVKASTAGDAKAIAALYTEDAIEMPPNEPAVKGRAAIQQFYEKQLKGAKLSNFSLSHVESRVSGDVAYDVGTYQQTITPTGGTAMPDTGKYTVILKRSGGSWRVAYAIYNSDKPAPAAGR